MSGKVAIVTGSNKGIGFAIVKGLCEKYDGTVYLTARDAARGKEAVEKLNKLGLKPEFHLLDIDNIESIKQLRDDIKEKHGGIDLLVNNAAIAFDNDCKEPIGYQAEHTLKTNYFNHLNVCNVLFPILRDNARVVNVSSCMGHLSKIPSADLRAKLSNPKLTVDELSQLMKDFIECAKNGTNKEAGWGNSTYAVSKVGVSALARIHQRLADEDPSRNLFINFVHPGYVITDMTNQKGTLTTEEGAKAPLYLCLEPVDWKGQFVWRDCTTWDWLADDLPALF